VSDRGSERVHSLSVGVVAVGGAVGQASRADARVRVGAGSVRRARGALRGARVGARAGSGRAGGAALGSVAGARKAVAVASGAASAAAAGVRRRRRVVARLVGAARRVVDWVVSRRGLCLSARTHRDRQRDTLDLGFELRTDGSSAWFAYECVRELSSSRDFSFLITQIGLNFGSRL
jgi:hypothetical protein